MTAASGQRHALIVATSDYRDPKLRKLRAPRADAERLATVLADPGIGGFDVATAFNEEEHRLRRRLAAFFSNRDHNDLLFLHFSCHGVKDEHGHLYLAATDTDMGVLSATGISSHWLNELISRTRSSRTVVLLDCCYSGSFPLGMRARANESVNVTDHFGGRGRAVITASNSMEYSYEGDQLSGAGKPSIFTAAVVEALETGQADRDQDHHISVSELYDYVFDRVKEKTPSQTPNILSGLEGPLYVARSSWQAPVEPAKLDRALLSAIESPFADVRAGAVDALQDQLGSSNPGAVMAARQALERMIVDDSRRVASKAQMALGQVCEEHHETTANVSAKRDPVPTGGASVSTKSASVPTKSGTISTKPSSVSPASGPDKGDPSERRQIRVLGIVAGALVLMGFLIAGIAPSDGNETSTGQTVGGFFVLAGGLCLIGMLVWMLAIRLTRN